VEVVSVQPTQANTSPRRRTRQERGSNGSKVAAAAPGHSIPNHHPLRRRLLIARRTPIVAAVLLTYVVALAFAIPLGRPAIALVTVGGYLLAVAARVWLTRHEC
jgi:hypothetical protein